ncbi:MAG: site-specific DNA-methyltransferase [Phycisphaerae bacterium]|nr:site-specific DNA-methyltransferase [Phycisphaerae bacterium]
MPNTDAHVLRADWLEYVRALAPASVDLLFADPPFNTGITRSSPPSGARRGRVTSYRYTDAWSDAAAYIDWLRVRLTAALPALRPAANILIHCDWRADHHVRILLDQLLGPDRFVNHIIWSYGLGGSSPRRFARKHDDILFYSRDPAACHFDPPRVPATSRRLAGRVKKATDVLDIPSLNNMARERTGYPTQKPVALLELLIAACCPPGGVVLDPCCGSGTTLVAAARLGRTALGCDLNPRAVALTRRRLERERPGRTPARPRTP